MRRKKMALVLLAVLGIGIAAGYVANEISSTGTVEIVEPEEPDTDSETADEPIDIYFADTGEETRTADFDGEEVEAGDSIEDDFEVVNNHNETFDVELEECGSYDVTYFASTDGEDYQEVDGDTFESPSVNENFFVRSEITVPEDSEPGNEEFCTFVTASPQ